MNDEQESVIIVVKIAYVVIVVLGSFVATCKHD